MNKASSILMSLCVLASLGANANTNEKNWYVGASFGSTSYDVEKSDFIFESDNSLESTFDKNDTGFKLYGGYQINQFFAVEIAYADLGQLTFTDGFYEFLPYGELESSEEAYLVTSSTSIGVTGLMVNGVAQYPITDSFSAFAKLGALRWSSEASAKYMYSSYAVIDGVIQSEAFNSSSETISGSASGTDAFYGLGLSYKIADFDIRAEYEIYKSDGESINVASIGALYRF